jgi:hypothetical protein
MSLSQFAKNTLPGLFLSVVSILLFTGCGPTQSARDQQQAQIRNDNRKTSDEYSTVVGLYKGTMTSEDGKVVHAELRVWLTVVTIVNAGSSTPTEIPTLAGSLSYQATPDMEDIQNLGSGSYDKNTHQVLLYSSTAAPNPGGSTTNAAISMRLSFENNRLSGYFYSSKVNFIDVTRVATVRKIQKKNKRTT